MQTILLLCSVLLILQQEKPSQDDIPTLIERLGADKVEERERAARALLELGDQAWPDLEKASKSKNAELRIRAEGILNEGRFRERVKSALNAPRLLTGKRNSVTLQEAAQAIGDAYDLDIQPASYGRFDQGIKVASIEFDKATLWESIDQLQRKFDVWGRPGMGNKVLLEPQLLRGRNTRWATYGNLRVFASQVWAGGEGSNRGGLFINFQIIQPGQNLPYKATIDGVYLLGKRLPFQPRIGDELTVFLPKGSFRDSTSVSFRINLRVKLDDRGGKTEGMLRLTIGDMPIIIPEALGVNPNEGKSRPAEGSELRAKNAKDKDLVTGRVRINDENHGILVDVGAVNHGIQTGDLLEVRRQGRKVGILVVTKAERYHSCAKPLNDTKRKDIQLKDHIQLIKKD